MCLAAVIPSVFRNRMKEQFVTLLLTSIAVREWCKWSGGETKDIFFQIRLQNI